jgi:hypothetical protein
MYELRFGVTSYKLGDVWKFEFMFDSFAMCRILNCKFFQNIKYNNNYVNRYKGL